MVYSSHPPWFILNTDGSITSNPRKIGVGPSLRPPRKLEKRFLQRVESHYCYSWTLSFTRRIKIDFVLKYTHLQIEINVWIVIKLAKGEIKENFLVKPLFYECEMLLEKIPKNLKHIYREANRCVNLLVKKG